MESLLLSVISEYLKDYVNNFTREQVSLNFLRGQGVIRNLDINVDAINELLFQSDASIMQFTRIMINTLSVQAPIMNLKNKPIIFFIDRLFIEIAEVADIVKRGPRKLQKKSATSKYGFLDRVLDSVSVEVNRITIAFLTLGRTKATTFGAWTPPVLLLECSRARLFCTNHNGVEAELNECFRIRTTKRPLLFVYKKLAVEKVSVYLVNPEIWFSVCDALIKDTSAANIDKLKLDGHGRGYVSRQIVGDTPVKIMICMRKRVDNNLLLGFELHVTIDTIEMKIRKQQLKELIHLVVGLYYCLLRQDALEEVFGPDPHNEGFQRQSSSGSGSISAVGASPTTTPETRKSSRSRLDTAEKASLARLDAGMTSAATVAGGMEDERERGEDWHRSSLNSDNDPPHLRSTIVFQIDEATVHIHVDSICPGTTRSQSVAGSNSNSGSRPGHSDRGGVKMPIALTISLTGLVHTTVWPEHASPMESVQQTTLRHFRLAEQIGVRKTCLLWTQEPLDSDGRPIFIAPLPRGIKEYSHNDLETLPGTSLILKKESIWPPPPVGKGLSASSELCVCKIGICFKSWDERMISGEWGVDVQGRRVNVMKGSSSQSVIIMTGIYMVLSPFLDLSRPSRGQRACLVPSEITLEVGLITLVSKPSLDISPLLPLLDFDSTQLIDDADQDNDDRGEERGGEGEGDNWQDTGQTSEDNSGADIHFPYRTDDLTNALKMAVKTQSGRTSHRVISKAGLFALTPPMPEPEPLLPVRFEASLAEITLCISDDFPARSYSRSGSSEKREMFSKCQSQSKVEGGHTGTLKGPPRRQIVKPFSLHFITSLDLHPFLDQSECPVDCIRTAYNREYYLSSGGGMIYTSYLSIEAVVVQSSLLDMMRLLETIETLQATVTSSVSYDLLTGHASTGQNTVASGDKNISMDPPRTAPSSLFDSKSPPSTIFILKLSNMELCLATERDFSALPVLRLAVTHFYCVNERPSLAAAAITSASNKSLLADSIVTGSEKWIADNKCGLEDEDHRIESERDTALCLEDHFQSGTEVQSTFNIRSHMETEGSFASTSMMAHSTSIHTTTYTSTSLFKIMCGNISLTDGKKPLLQTFSNAKPSDVYLQSLHHTTTNSLGGADRRRNPADSTPFLVIRADATVRTVAIAPDQPYSTSAYAIDKSASTISDGDGDGDSGARSHHTALPISSTSIVLSAKVLGARQSQDTEISATQRERDQHIKTDGQDLRTASVVLVPNRALAATQNVLKELLEGFGCITMGATSWWEDTVYGYIKSRLEEVRGNEELESHRGTDTKADSCVSDLAINIDAPTLSIILLALKDHDAMDNTDEPMKAQGLCCYSALSVDLTNIELVAERHSESAEAITGSEFSSSSSCSIAMNASSHLYIHSNEDQLNSISNSSGTVRLFDSFPLGVNLSSKKPDSEPASMECNVNLADFSSQLAALNSGKVIHLLTNFTSQYQSTMKLIDEFTWSLTKELLPCSPPVANGSGQKVTDLLGRTPCDLSRNESIDTHFVSFLMSPLTSQQEMTSEISRTLHATKMNLNHLYQTSLRPSQSATAAIKDSLLMCEELLKIAGKLRQTALLTVGMTPIYCGWVVRSQGLLTNPSRASTVPRSTSLRESGSSWGIKSWAVLVKGSLLFLAKPYSKTVDFSIAMNRLLVSDPDENQIAALSTAAGASEKTSSCIWCVAGEETLVLDCGEEKLLWLDALFPWLATSGPGTKEAKMRSSTYNHTPAGVRGDGRRLRPGGMLTDEAVLIDNTGGRVQQIVASSLGTAAAAMRGAITIGGLEEMTAGSSSQGIAAVAANAKKIQSATSDLMRAFAVGNSLSNNFGASIITNIASNPVLSTKVQTSHLDSCQQIRINANTLSDGNRLMHIERGTETDLPLDFSGVLDSLDAVTSPLSDAKSLLDGALSLSLALQADTALCLRSSLKGVTQAVIGLSSLHSISEKVYVVADRCRRQSIASVESARVNVRDMREEMILLKSMWGKADRNRTDQEILLQTCTMQHIATVMDMTDRYDSLKEDYLSLSASASDPTSGSMYFKDLLRDLKGSMVDNENLLRAAEEKEAMMAEEIASVVTDALTSRMENKQIKSELDALRLQMVVDAERHAVSLAAAVNATHRAESDRAELESKLISALSALGQLQRDSEGTE